MENKEKKICFFILFFCYNASNPFYKQIERRENTTAYAGVACGSCVLTVASDDVFNKSNKCTHGDQ